MKKSSILTILCSLAMASIIFIAMGDSTPVKAQTPPPPVPVWLKQAGGDFDDRGKEIVIDAEENIFVRGHFEESATFDNITLTGMTPQNSFFAKYNTKGNLLWVKQTDALAIDIAVDEVGNLFVTGIFTTSATFEDTVITSAWESSIFIAKYSPDGSLLWAKHAGSSERDIYVHSITIDTTGAVFINGRFLLNASFDTKNFSYISYQNFTAKHSTTGDEQWVRLISRDVFFSNNIIRDRSGNSFVIDARTDSIQIIRYNASGRRIWIKQIEGINGIDSKTPITIDEQGNLFVAEYFTQQAIFDNYEITGDTIANIFIAKYNGFGILQWVAQASSSTDINITDIALDEAGNPLVVGYFNEDVTLGNRKFETTGVDDSDIFMAQYDTNDGQLTWGKQLGGAETDKAYGITHNGGNNLFMTGYFEGATEFDGFRLSSTQGENIFVAKFNIPGYPILDVLSDTLVAHVIKDTRPIVTEQITITNQGTAPLNWTASTEADWLTLQPTTGTNTETVTITADATLLQAGIYTAELKIESNGGDKVMIFTLGVTKEPDIPVWAKQSHTNGGEARSYDITADAAGNLFITGSFEGDVTFDDVVLENDNNYNRNDDIFIVKYNPNGRVEWAKQAGGKEDDSGRKVETDAAGNLFVTGSFRETTTFETIKLVSRESTYINSSFIAKYSNLGQLQWAKAISDISGNYITGIATDSSGNLLITGYFYDLFQFGNNQLRSIGRADIFIIKYDSQGQLLWFKQIGSISDDQGWDVTTDQAGNIFVVGSYEDSINFGNTTLTPQGYKEMFIAKYSPTGTLLWVKNATNQYNSTSTNITVDSSGNLLVAGKFNGPITLEEITLQPTLNYGTDIFIAKYTTDGVLMWINQAGTRRDDIFVDDITVDASDNLIVMGRIRNTAIFYPVEVTSSNSGNSFIAKYNPDGVLSWVDLIESSTLDGQGITVGHQNHLFVTGNFHSQFILGDTILTSGSWDFEAFIAKFTSSNQPLLFASTHNLSFEALYNHDNPASQYITITNQGLETLDWTISKTAPWLKINQMTGVNDAVIEISIDIRGLKGGLYTDQIIINSNGGDYAIEVTVEITPPPPVLLGAEAIGGEGDDFGTGIAGDSQGNLLVIGQFTNNMQVGNTLLTSLGGTDSFVAKYAPDESLLWVKQLGAKGEVLGRAITTDSADNILVIGYFSGNLILDDTILTSAGVETSDVFVAKYDSQGTLLWAKHMGSWEWDRGYGIATDTSDNVLITGYFKETVTVGNDQIVSQGMGDIFVAKYSADGSALWARQAGGVDFDEGQGIATDSADNVFITGYFRDKANFGTTLLANNMGTHHDTFIAKYNTDGQLQWAKQGRGQYYDNMNMGRDITISNDNLVCITGYFYDRLEFDEFSLNSRHDHMTFVVCYDTTGQVQWVDSLGRYSDDDTGYGITTDLTGHLLVTGQFGGRLYADGNRLITAGDTDAFIAHYKPDGQLLWIKQAGGIGRDAGYGIAVDGQGDILITGRIENKTAFDHETVTSTGQGDIFISRQGYPREPYLTVSDLNFTFDLIKQPQPPITKLITITNSGLEPLIWTLTDNPEWLIVSQISGTNTTAVMISLDITKLNTGTHHGNITINSNGGQRTVQVTLNLTSIFKRGGVVSSVRDTPNDSSSQSLQQARDMGLDVVLMPLGWDRIEMNSGSDNYNWAELDDILIQAKRYNLKVVLRLYNAPAWYTPDGASPTAPPTDPERMYDLMYKMGYHLRARKLTDQVAGVVIWNEPNIPDQWGGQPANAADYMALLKAAYQGANYYSNDLTIVSAGLAPTETGNGAINDLDYLAQLYDLGLADYVDYVGLNGLGFQHDPDYDPGTASYSFSRLKYMHDIMIAKGDPYRRVWVLEVGWLRDNPFNMGAFNPYKVSAEQQTQYLNRAFEKAEHEWDWVDLVAIWNIDFHRFYPPTSAFYWYSPFAVDVKWDNRAYLPVIQK